MSKIRTFVIASTMTGVAVVGVQTTTAGPAAAWSTSQSANAVCVSATGLVDVNGLFKNTEPSNAGPNYDMLVTMTRIKPDGSDGETTPVQTVVRQEQKSFVIHTNLSSLPAGKVRFDLKWVSQGGSDKRYANFNAVHNCLKEVPVPPQPPSQDMCNPPGVTNNVSWVPASGPSDTAEYDWTLNLDQSLTVVPQPGHAFPGQQQSYTFQLPPDSGVTCPQPPPPPNCTTNPTMPGCLPPPAYVNYSQVLKCDCVTGKFGEFTARVKNVKRSTESIRVVVKVNNTTVKKLMLKPGQRFVLHRTGVRVGSVVKLIVNGHVYHKRIPNKCGAPPPSGPPATGLRGATSSGKVVPGKS